MSSQELKSLSVSEKLELLEAIWVDFRETYQNSEIPNQHKEVLDSRRERYLNGETKLLDWDSVKSSIGKG